MEEEVDLGPSSGRQTMADIKDHNWTPGDAASIDQMDSHLREADGTAAVTAILSSGTIGIIVKGWLDGRLAAAQATYQAALNKRLEEAKTEFAKDLELVKLGNEKDRRIHELQFTTEFEVYKLM